MKQLGSLRPEDIPLSAVDFHISDIVYHLLDKPEITTAALEAAREPLELMRHAIWAHSSSINRRSWLLVGVGCTQLSACFDTLVGTLVGVNCTLTASASAAVLEGMRR